MKNILLISKATEQAQEIKQALAKIPGYNVTLETSGKNPGDLSIKGALDCVIFNFESVGVVQVAVIRSTCEVVNVQNVIVFTDSVDDGALDLLLEDKSLTLIEKPLLDLKNDIAGLCVRLIDLKVPKFSRESVRHPARQEAMVTTDLGKNYKGRIVNISDKGACLDINTNALKVSDNIKISFFLDKLNRQRVIVAEVRWIKPFPGKSLIGVKFL